MGFETNVVETVNIITDSEHHVEFNDGTLYVECNEKQADTIVRVLKENYNISRVKVSKNGNDFAFEFI